MIRFVLLFFLAFGLHSNGFITIARAASTPIIIQEIQTSKSENADLLDLTLSKNLAMPISYYFEPGQVRITLPDTDFKPSIENLHINDRFLKNARFFKEGKNSLLIIYFSNPKFQAIGRVKSQALDNRLRLIISKEDPIENDQNDSVKSILSSVPKKIEEQNALSSFSGDMLNTGDVTVSIIKMLLALSGVLAFLYFLLWVYNRFFVSRFNITKGNHRIRLISSYHISPKQKVIILKVDEKTFACGVTANSFSLISEIAEDQFDSFITQHQFNPKETVDFAKLRNQYRESRERKENKTKKKRKPDFANELIERVKHLKPID